MKIQVKAHFNKQTQDSKKERMNMPEFRVYGAVSTTKYIGEFEAATKEEAEKMAWEMNYSCPFVIGVQVRLKKSEIEELVVEEVE